MSMPAQSLSLGHFWWQCSTTWCPSAIARLKRTRFPGYSIAIRSKYSTKASFFERLLWLSAFLAAG